MSDGSESTTRGLAELLEHSYPALRRIAAVKARTTGVDPSSLAQDAVCRLLKLPNPPTTTAAVEGVAWQLMEWIVVDRLRADRARLDRQRRDGHPTENVPASVGAIDAISPAIRELSELSPRKAEALMLWSVSEMSMDRIGELLGVSAKTVQRDIEFAKAWMAARVNPRSSLSDGKGRRETPS